MNPHAQPFGFLGSDPFAEIQRRHEADWKHLFLAEPPLLEGNSNARLIRCWEEIPDVFTLAAPATEWLVEGLVPRASVMLIAGEPGSYKTWLALALLRGVASGGNFLGRACAQTSVLYLDRENPLAVVRERLAVLGIDALTGSRIWGGWACDAPPAIGDARLEEIARDRRPLIVFDSLIRFHDADENSATEMAGVMGGLRALANAGATVVALHHKPKSEATLYRGSSDIAGGVDMAWAVSRDRAANLLRVECFKSRFAEEFSLTLRPELGGRAVNGPGFVGAQHAAPGADAWRDVTHSPGGSGRTGEFVVTNAPEIDAEQSDVEKLADAIRRSPGQPKESVIEASGVARDRARVLLERYEGREWRSERGARKSLLFYPIDDGGTDPTADEADDKPPQPFNPLNRHP